MSASHSVVNLCDILFHEKMICSTTFWSDFGMSASLRVFSRGFYVVTITPFQRIPPASLVNERSLKWFRVISVFWTTSWPSVRCSLVTYAFSNRFKSFWDSLEESVSKAWAATLPYILSGFCINPFRLFNNFDLWAMLYIRFISVDPFYFLLFISLHRPGTPPDPSFLVSDRVTFDLSTDTQVKHRYRNY